MADERTNDIGDTVHRGTVGIDFGLLTTHNNPRAVDKSEGASQNLNLCQPSQGNGNGVLRGKPTFVTTTPERLSRSRPRKDESGQHVTFLDKFRLRNSSPRYLLKKGGNKSRSLLSSPTNGPQNHEFLYGTSPSGNSDILFGHFPNNASDDSSHSTSKSKKWYSFTSLLSRSGFKGILNIPRSRLSVSSLFTSESDDVTPTELPDFGFPGYSPHHRVPASPSPSCVTVPGEFPSRAGGGSSSIVFRRPRYAQRSCSCSVSASSTSASASGGGDDVPLDSPVGSRTLATRNRNRTYRNSCGEFYPGTPSSPGFLGLDFQFHSYSRNTPGSGKSSLDGVIQPKRALGRSLPTLLEAMEFTKLEGTTEESFSGRSSSSPLTVESVAELLYHEYVILTGSKTLDEHYLLIFPDRGNFHQLGDGEYKMLVKYLISIPSMQDTESGFVLIIDRRNDKWNSVKTTLLRISGYFPALIHRVFVLRPSGFLQKALSEVSSKLFRNENLRFRLTVCNHVTDLLSFIDTGQLTMELGGTLLYDKVQWVQERVEVESFHFSLQNLSRDLKTFTEAFMDFEYPNDVITTDSVIQNKTTEFIRLKSDLTKAGKHGETILKRIKNQDRCEEQSQVGTTSSVQLVNVILLQRFILQIEETGNLFQEFWDKERISLERCLHLRRFEHDFRELQISFDLHVKSLNGIPEMGESVEATEVIILDTVNYQDITKFDLTRALQLEVIGREIVSTNPTAVDTVEPKCLELSRMASHFRFILQEKLTKQKQWREVQSTIQKANELCTEGMDLLSSQQMTESTDESPDWINLKIDLDSLSIKIQSQVEELVTLKMSLTVATATQAKTLVKQILKRVEDVQSIVTKRQIILLQHLETKKQSGNTFFKTRRTSGTFFDSSKTLKVMEDTSDGSSFSSMTKISISSSDLSMGNWKTIEDEDREKQIKRFHVLQELLQTEQTYVEEIGLILMGYRDQAMNPEVKSLLPVQFTHDYDKTKSDANISILFCNLDEIYSFHSKIFLPDLTTCIESIELVALCFIQRHSDFLAMYSQYCQLKGASDILLKEIGENHAWLSWCQEKLGHRLPLSSYLLKPVQRITKYHLLLGNLVKYSETCDGYAQLLEALDCMVVVVRSVNDGMHQLQIRGYTAKLSSEGPLLLQGQFTVWIETTKNRLRLKGHQRYLFLYQKSILVCKKTGQQSSLTYEFKNKVNLSEVGITEDPKGSGASKKFEIWIQGRQKVFLFQASSRDMKSVWVNEIKKLLMEQLQYLREAKGSTHVSRTTNQSASSVKRNRILTKGNTLNGYRTTSVTTSSHLPLRPSSSYEQTDNSRPKSRGIDTDAEDDFWSSGISNSEDEESFSQVFPLSTSGTRGGGTTTSSVKSRKPLNKNGSSSSMVSSFYGVGENVENGPKYITTTSYTAVDPTLEISLKENDVVVLVKTGCAGWWFVRNSSGVEGWAPKAYLEKLPCSSILMHSSSSSQSVSRDAVLPTSNLQKQSSVPCLPFAEQEQRLNENGGNPLPLSSFQYEASVILQMCNELGSTPQQ